MEGLPSSEKIVNINSVKRDGNVTLKADKGYFSLSYYKNKTHFFDPKTYIAFIKGVEKTVRGSEEYKAYKNYLMTEVGLDYDVVMGNIRSDGDIELEMHHGPIFTLFDIVAIILEYMIIKGEDISTFSVSEKTLQAHYDNTVQVVMLCKTNHQAVHAGKVFISSKQAFGDVNPFIEKYREGITQEQIDVYNQYVKLCEEHNSTDNGFLNSQLSNWNKSNNICLEGDDFKDE